MIFKSKKGIALLGVIGLLVAVCVLGVTGWILSVNSPRSTSQLYGVGMRLEVDAGKLSGDVLPQHLVRVPFDVSLKQLSLPATLSLRSDLPVAETYSLTMLLDYVQTPIGLNGVTRDIHVLEAGAYSTQDVDLTLSIPNLEGRHKVALLLFRSLGLGHPDDQFHRPYDSMFTSFDFDLIIGADRTPEVAYQTPSNTRAEAPRINFGGIAVDRTPVPDKMTDWVTDQVSSTSPLNYYIHLGNDNRPRAPYAIVAFLDGRQIPITNTGDLIAFGYIEADGRVTLPGQLQIPPDGARHELQVLYVLHPFELTIPPGNTESAGPAAYPLFIPGLRIALVSRE